MPIMSCVNPSRHPDTPESTRNSSQQCQVGDLGHLIADNYATHKTALIRNWFAKRPRFHIHFTPTSASWLNLVERWFGLLTEKQLRRGVHQSSDELEAAIYRYLDVTNEDPKPLVWTKTADQILASVARFCQRTLDTGH